MMLHCDAYLFVFLLLLVKNVDEILNLIILPQTVVTYILSCRNWKGLHQYPF